jgi:hypothetical protein
LRSGTLQRIRASQRKLPSMNELFVLATVAQYSATGAVGRQQDETPGSNVPIRPTV